jgi:hypothetical protein
MQKWTEAASSVLDEMEAETASHELRKAFYAGDGAARAQRMIAELDALRLRAQNFVRA